MHWYQSSFVGMHFMWWIFWGALIVIGFSWATPVPRRRMRLYEHPLTTLSRRYVAGELTTTDYDERRTRIDADMRDLGLVLRPAVRATT